MWPFKKKQAKESWLDQQARLREEKLDKSIKYRIAESYKGIWIERGYYDFLHNFLPGCGVSIDYENQRICYSECDYFGRTWFPHEPFSGIHYYKTKEEAIERLNQTNNFTNVDFSIKYTEVI